MITIAADWIRVRWPELVARGSLLIPLSQWDDGDAFTLAELGPLPGPVRVIGCVVLRGAADRDAPVVVSLSRHEGPPGTHTFAAADGHTYAATAQRLEGESTRPLDVQVVEGTAALAERRTALLESTLLIDAHVGI